MRHHLVVIKPHYLDLLLAGHKRIECRLSSVRKSPFEAVRPGDLLWLKLPSGPVTAVARAGPCRFRAITQPGELHRWLRPHRSAIRAESGFFQDAERWCRFVSLVWIKMVVKISPMPVYKSDQRSWVVLDESPRPQMRLGPIRRRVTVSAVSQQ